LRRFFQEEDEKDWGGGSADDAGWKPWEPWHCCQSVLLDSRARITIHVWPTLVHLSSRGGPIQDPVLTQSVSAMGGPNRLPLEMHWLLFEALRLLYHSGPSRTRSSHAEISEAHHQQMFVCERDQEREREIDADREGEREREGEAGRDRERGGERVCV